eukprot:COSAG02_NODE_7615_length_2932_cov_2.414755_2_plen_88_part_00
MTLRQPLGKLIEPSARELLGPATSNSGCFVLWFSLLLPGRELLESSETITEASLISIGKAIAPGVVAFPILCDAWCEELLDELDGRH